MTGCCGPCVHYFRSLLQKKGKSGKSVELKSISVDAPVNIKILAHGAGVSANGLRVKGGGSALASSMLEQDASYWEIHVVKTGTISVGVSRRASPEELASPVGSNPNSFGSTWRPLELQVGDVVGVCFGQSSFPMLDFTVNGVEAEGRSVVRVRGDVFPIVSVSDGAEVLFVFSDFKFPAPNPRFKRVLIAREILRS
eukprot:c11102_g1_i1.p1 GENE.c11102_g1_i1~~c11102_g1_i1.p1  ORF type:complete len:197 (+),score=34.19 c11102_g1_i1:1130-1720(+)